MNPSAASCHAAPRCAYTAIELLLVFGIVAILAVAAVPAVSSTLRRASFNESISQIRSLASQAQILAIRAPAAVDGELYGVRLAMTGRQPVVELILGEQILGSQRQLLPQSIAIRLNGEVMTEGTSVAWFYQPGTGQTMAKREAQYFGPGVQVGCPIPSNLPVGLTADDVVLVARQTDSRWDGVPGIEIASRDGALRSVLRVMPTGVLVFEIKTP